MIQSGSSPCGWGALSALTQTEGDGDVRRKNPGERRRAEGTCLVCEDEALSAQPRQAGTKVSLLFRIFIGQDRDLLQSKFLPEVLPALTDCLQLGRILARLCLNSAVAEEGTWNLGTQSRSQAVSHGSLRCV